MQPWEKHFSLNCCYREKKGNLLSMFTKKAAHVSLFFPPLSNKATMFINYKKKKKKRKNMVSGDAAPRTG